MSQFLYNVHGFWRMQNAVEFAKTMSENDRQAKVTACGTPMTGLFVEVITIIDWDSMRRLFPEHVVSVVREVEWKGGCDGPADGRLGRACPALKHSVG